ncbi:hypothetical protein JYP46_10660 [Nitratireductor aquimarinus]|uniref:hypothetical protein n=1 Tax=Alphaproteobacteria TaxID=28211 RepID=UPI0019D35A8C|nr:MULTISPECIES: hypothetical protein [Alphaproteobacteria]MBN7757278.1 hypothetical protein [Nitratireductor aquimarinus]MBY6000038.1 hypothetical protein [Tritonibacter mobilis]MBY6022066.1 hypothetical protein [Nitratireductor sp. DP7N14-4]
MACLQSVSTGAANGNDDEKFRNLRWHLDSEINERACNLLKYFTYLPGQMTSAAFITLSGERS